MFKVYSFNKYSYEIGEMDVIKETNSMFITPAKQFYPKGQRLLKETNYYTWRISRLEAVNDGIRYLKSKQDSLQHGLSKVEMALGSLEKEKENV